MRFLRIDDAHPLNGWHMLGIVGLFFGTIIGVNVVMAVVATGTFPGIVVANSYVASQHYNEMLAAARRQEEAGWQAELSAEGGTLRLRFRDASGTLLSALDVSAMAGRPSTAQEDRAVAFRGVDAGVYESMAALPPGLWEIDLEVRRGDDLLFRTNEAIYVAPGGDAR
jgi:nitrogen fixation protein FixH